MKTVAQYTFLALLSSVIVFCGAIFWAWKDSVGIDAYAQSVKYFIDGAAMLAGVLGLTLAGDKALIASGFWSWLRNVALQNVVVLWSANLLGVFMLLAIGYVWSEAKKITIYSDRSIILMNIYDLAAPKEIGYLPGGQERTVLIQRGRTQIGYRVAGTNNFGKASVPKSADALEGYVLITTKDAENGAKLLVPKAIQ